MLAMWSYSSRGCMGATWAIGFLAKYERQYLLSQLKGQYVQSVKRSVHTTYILSNNA